MFRKTAFLSHSILFWLHSYNTIVIAGGRRREKKLIYLTGGIATGKTTVARMFAELGAHVIDADKIAHKVIEKGRKAYDLVVNEFGEGILDESGEIDRRKLGSIVFGDKEKLHRLESIIHPEVISEMAREVAESHSDLIVIEIPLIFEKGLDLHPTVLVYAPRHIQIERLKKRDALADKEIIERLNSQIDIELKRKMADYVIDNSGEIEKTWEQVKEVFKEILEVK